MKKGTETAITKSNAKPVGIKDYIGYAMGDFGCNMSFGLISNYMMLYFTQCIGLSLDDWAWIIIVGKVWDAINDPIIGGLVDRVRIGKGSKYKPWIMLGGIMLVACTTLSFLPLYDLSRPWKVFYCLAIYCLWSVAYTTANVPYGAMHSAITSDPDKRTNLSTFRSIGAGLAQGPMMVLLPLIMFDKDDNIIGKRVVFIALICSVAGLIGFMLVRALVTERVEITQEKQKFSYAKAITAFAKNKPMIALSIVSFFNIVCFMSMTSVNSIVFQTYFKNAQLLSVANVISYLPMVILMPLVGIISKKIGKKKFLLIITLISSVAGIVLFAVMKAMNPLSTAALVVWIIGLMFMYLGNAGFGIVCWAMVVDCIDYGFEKSGVKEEGTTYAIYSFFRKFAQGIGSAFSAQALSWCGYIEKNGANQTAEVAEKVKDMYLVVMIAGLAVSLLVLKFLYSIKENKTEKRR